MSDQWSRLGLDLHVGLGPAHGLRAGLEHALRQAERGGRLPQGTPTAPNVAFGYGDPAGSATLREALAEYLGRSRGVVTTPDRVFVCAGYTHALRLICQALRHLGAASIAVEDPSEPCYPALSARLGLRATHIPVDQDGLVGDRLTDEDAVTVTPAHQYPLGVTLSPARRAELLAWAERSGSFVVEDDYDGEFRYARQPVGARQGLAPDRV